MLELRFAKSAEKTLARMPAGIARRMVDELKTVASDPAAYRGDFKPLAGTACGWRLRVGDWRALCELRNDQLILRVVKISPRGDAYK